LFIQAQKGGFARAAVAVPAFKELVKRRLKGHNADAKKDAKKKRIVDMSETNFIMAKMKSAALGGAPQDENVAPDPSKGKESIVVFEDDEKDDADVEASVSELLDLTMSHIVAVAALVGKAASSQ
jgi:hypothetical protein